MKIREIKLKNVVWKEGKHYVSQCLNVDVSSFGRTKKESLDNLKEALELYFQDENSTRIPSIIRPEIVSMPLRYA